MTDAYDKALEAVATMTTNTPAGLSAEWQTTARKVAAFDHLLEAASNLFVDGRLCFTEQDINRLKAAITEARTAQGGAS